MSSKRQKITDFGAIPVPAISPPTFPVLRTVEVARQAEEERQVMAVEDQIPTYVEQFVTAFWQLRLLSPRAQQTHEHDFVALEEYLAGWLNSPTMPRETADVFRADCTMRLIETCPAVYEENGRKMARLWLVLRSHPKAERKRSLIDLIERLGTGEICSADSTARPKIWIARDYRANKDIYLLLKGRNAYKIATALQNLFKKAKELAHDYREEEISSAMAENPAEGYSLVSDFLGGVPVDSYTFRFRSFTVRTSKGPWSYPPGAVTIFSDGKIVRPLQGFGAVRKLIQAMVDEEVELSIDEVQGTGHINMDFQVRLAEDEFERRLRFHKDFRAILQNRLAIERAKRAFDDYVVGQVGQLRRLGDITEAEFCGDKVGRAILEWGPGKPFTAWVSSEDKKSPKPRDVYSPVVAVERTSKGTLILEGYRAPFTKGGGYIKDLGLDLFAGLVGREITEGEKFAGVLEIDRNLGNLYRVLYARITQRVRRAEQKVEGRAKTDALDAARDAKYATEAAEAERLLAEPGDGSENTPETESTDATEA